MTRLICGCLFLASITGVGAEEREITLVLAGDVMTGRAIDLILPHPGDPTLHERYSKSARDYLQLAERASGPIDKPVPFEYPWGDALPTLVDTKASLVLLNLETAVTSSSDHWPGKAVHYRMHPDNAPTVAVLAPAVFSLANNHVLDWGHAGLLETLRTIGDTGAVAIGAGVDEEHAARPAIVEVADGSRLLVYAFGSTASGIPSRWAATADRPGVNILRDFSARTVERLASSIDQERRPGDRVIVSIHWGSNWGYAVPYLMRQFARALVDRAGVDLIHGHSSHHWRPLEVYRGRLILYGCGDLINDYEGIEGRRELRPDLALLYRVGLSAETGALRNLEIEPFQIKQLRLRRATKADIRWLGDALNREGRDYGTQFQSTRDGTFVLGWR